jgi:adhesin transport system membrane fusion protein
VALDWEAFKASNTKIRAQDIKPGMTATADVLTGERSVLSFILKPITRAFSGALTQR